MSGEGGTSCEVELVSCSLSELSSCLCLHGSLVEEEGTSRRKITSHSSDIILEDIFIAAKRAILRHKPTLIDQLIYRNRSALVMGPKKARGGSSNAGVKRKREPDPSSSTASAKKVKGNSTNAGGSKKGPSLGARTLKKKFNSESASNRKSSRISSNKRVPISLRSGRKLADKKKRIEERKKLKSEKDSNSNLCTAEANGVKSEDEVKREGVKKEVIAPAKKEPVTVKKATPVVKKEAANQKLAPNKAVQSSKKTGNKSDAGGSGTSENVLNEGDVKKKRRKRKRCSMYVRKFNKVSRKKESGSVGDQGDPLLEDDDDDPGRASDASMMSSTTQESNPLLGTTCSGVEEKPNISIPLVEASDKLTVTASEKLVTKVEDDIKVEDEFAEPRVEEGPSEVPRVVNSNDVAAVPDAPHLNSDDLATEELGKPAVLDEPIASDALMEQRPVAAPLKESIESNDEPAISSAVACAVVSEDVVPAEDEDDIENSGLDSPSITVVPSVIDANVSIPVDKLSEPKLLSSTEETSISSHQSGDLVIASCQSLVNTPLEETVLRETVDDYEPESAEDAKVETDVCCSKETEVKADLTEVPDQVPSLIENKQATPDGASAEKESELKRDADSTTCDNPRCLDDSFGDLSLYVSEDDLSHSKDHDEGLPDSTNITQVETPLENDEAPFESQTLDVDVKTEQVITNAKTEELVENLTEEQQQMKESVLQALGLKSLSSSSQDAPEEKPPKRSDGYTGTLKAVIKLNRSGDKQHMVYKRSEDDLAKSDKLEYRICSEIPSDEKTGNDTKKLPTEPSDVAEGDDTNEDGSGKESNLIIPEKSSSFSIHPGRLCSDVCSYCFGKFGSLDTPCHVAQLKGEERQRKILENETHLTGESCLCDACYRYVDRKANFPEKLKVGRLKPPAQSSVCCVTHCSEPATRTIKRKWLVKLKKSITDKFNIDMEKLGHGVYYPFCTQHHYWVEFYTICGICRKRLNRNNLFALGAEADRLNLMLAEDGIPARLSVNLFLCKLCRYYADLRLKYPDPTAIPSSNQIFYKNYRRKILMSLDLPVSDSDDELMQPQDDSKKKHEGPHSDSKTDEDVMSLTGLATLLGEQPQQQAARIQVKFGNVNIGTLSNLNIGQQGASAVSAATTSSGNALANTTLSGSNVNGSNSHHKNEPTYPEVSLSANFEYQGPTTPDGSWERYQSTLQFDKKTKQLWTELQRPYGSQTSFLRHLVMLERVWRDGYLVLASDADEAASRYITSARNRIKAFETQGPKMQMTTPTVTTAPPPAPVVATQQTPTVPASRPSVTVAIRKPQTSTQSFPFLTNTGEIEVTPIRSNKPSPAVHQQTTVPSKTPAIQQRLQLPPQRSGPHQIPLHTLMQGANQQNNNPRKITPLDRAKSLVRMAPLYQQIQQHTQSGDRRAGSSAVRFMGAPHGSIPPLVRLPQTQPTQFYSQPQQMYHPSQKQMQQFQQQQLQQQQQQLHQQQQQLQQQQLQQQKLQQQQLHQHINQQQTFFQNQPPAPQRVPLPKLPRNLTVVSMPARPSLPQAITLSHSGITIEKQLAPTRTTSLPIERPSISVFREPATP